MGRLRIDIGTALGIFFIQYLRQNQAKLASLKLFIKNYIVSSKTKETKNHWVFSWVELKSFGEETSYACPLSFSLLVSSLLFSLTSFGSYSASRCLQPHSLHLIIHLIISTSSPRGFRVSWFFMVVQLQEQLVIDSVLEQPRYLPQSLYSLTLPSIVLLFVYFSLTSS